MPPPPGLNPGYVPALSTPGVSVEQQPAPRQRREPISNSCPCPGRHLWRRCLSAGAAHHLASRSQQLVRWGRLPPPPELWPLPAGTSAGHAPASSSGAAAAPRLGTTRGHLLHGGRAASAAPARDPYGTRRPRSRDVVIRRRVPLRRENGGAAPAASEARAGAGARRVADRKWPMF